MSDAFAQHFRRLVIPQLRDVAMLKGTYVMAGLETWDAAYDELWKIARDRGALHLRDPDELHDWLAAELLTQIDAAERRGAA